MPNRLMLASVLIAILLCGGFAFLIWTAAPQTEIGSPCIEVTACYPGAKGDTLRETVATPIEYQVNGVERMTSMESKCTDEGICVLTITFRPRTDLNLVQVLVQNRVALAAPILPKPVRDIGIIVKKIPNYVQARN